MRTKNGFDKLKKNDLIKLFCEVDENGNYIGKTGSGYINSLVTVFYIKNKNDMPFLIEDVIKQPELKDFSFEGIKDFRYVCKLKPHPVQILKEYSSKLNRTKGRINEYIEPYDFDNDEVKEIFNNSLGVVYILTAVVDGKEYIIKIGQSRKTFKDRLSSYNCGCLNNYHTASTTNIKILQSIVVNPEITFKLYLYDCCKMVSYTWHGVTSIQVASSESIAYENIINNKFIEQFGHPPLANVQVNI